MLSNTMVMFLRLLTGSELQKREDFFAPFVMVRRRCCFASLAVNTYQASSCMSSCLQPELHPVSCSCALPVFEAGHGAISRSCVLPIHQIR